MYVALVMIELIIIFNLIWQPLFTNNFVLFTER